MEDSSLYIESGILELYVLGDLSREEALEVEVMASKYPEIKIEISSIELAMESYALENALEPSTPARSKILDLILGVEGVVDRKVLNVELPVIVTPYLHPTKSGSDTQNNFYKYAFAACLALLLISLAALTGVYSRLQDSKQELLAIQVQNRSFANRVNLLDQHLDILQDPEYQLVKLAGTPKSASSSMLVVWNQAKKEVLIDKKALKLPINDEQHQYQLWALVDGKPVDLGVFDTAMLNEPGMMAMKSTAAADAFAVTLEPRGGSAAPTMDQLVLMGKTDAI
ncbi:MAG: anti-sigma factor domain-containing protein [Sphingobacteriaceae bacterium]